MTTTTVTLDDERIVDMLSAVEAGIYGLAPMLEGGEHIHTVRAINGLQDLVFLAIEHFRARLEEGGGGVHQMNTLADIENSPKVTHADDIG